MKFTRYDTRTGLILEFGERPVAYPDLADERMTMAQLLGLALGPHEALIEGNYSDAHYRIVGGEAVSLAPPGPLNQKDVP